MPKVTENWSGSRLSLRAPFSAEKEFVVTGVNGNETAALTAVDSDTGVRIYQRREGHPGNPERLKCEGPSIKERKGPDYFVITCPFVQDDGSLNDNTDDPLTQPVSITWSPVRTTFPVDHDLDNKPIINSAGDFFEALPTQELAHKELRIVKNMPFYDLSLSRDFELAVNRDRITLSGQITVAPEHMKCEMIGPAVSDYAPDAPFLPIAFVFSVMPEMLTGAHPWAHRMIDSGHYGWGDKGGGTKIHGPFVNERAERFGELVRLNGSGSYLPKPYGSSALKIGGAYTGEVYPAVSAPTNAQPFATEYYKGDGTSQTAPNDQTESVILYYKAVRIVDFSRLMGML
jgi:hypothetical protein